MSVLVSEAWKSAQPPHSLFSALQNEPWQKESTLPDGRVVHTGLIIDMLDLLADSLNFESVAAFSSQRAQSVTSARVSACDVDLQCVHDRGWTHWMLMLMDSPNTLRSWEEKPPVPLISEILRYSYVRLAFQIQVRTGTWRLLWE